MTWSLKLQNGDLSIGAAQLGQIVGGQKVAQDLRCAILEEMGTDPDHPWFGSLVNGGIDENGVVQPGIIGTDDFNRAASMVEADIRRIVEQYQAQQLARSQSDRFLYGSATLTPNELLTGLTGLEFYAIQDTLLIRVTLQTADSNQFTLNIPVGGT